MPDSADTVHAQDVTAIPDGRVTIPAQMRRATGMEPGRRLVIFVEHGRVVVEERQHLVDRIQAEAIAAAEKGGSTGGAVDDLVVERRVAAAWEVDAAAPSPRESRG